MPLETGTTISQLDDLWPLGGDPILQGDDHLRLIKAVLKAQFPGEGGLGFNKAITASEDELNYSVGVTSSIQDQIDAITIDDGLLAPSGTVMLFASVAPPTGWTQVVANNKSLLQHVSDGSGGASGGAEDILSVWSHVHTTGDHQLLVSEMPSHSHNMNVNINETSTGNVTEGSGATRHIATESTGGDGTHNHGNTDTITFDPKYLNVITASKD